MLSLFQLCKIFYLSVFFLLYCCFSYPAHTTTIGLSQIVDHPALNMTARGILDTLKSQPALKIIVENAQGNIAVSAQIAQKFVGINVQCIVAIGTSSALAARNAVKGTTIPVIFATVTDPKAAQLVQDIMHPEGQITGSSNFIAIPPQIALFLKLRPDLKRLGMIYSPSEINGTYMVEATRLAAKDKGIDVVAVSAHTSAHVATAARSLASKVDAFFISNDNVALSAFDAIVKVANEEGIPVFASDIDLIDQGALAAMGPSQYEVGVLAGQYVLKILNDTPIKNLPVVYPHAHEIHINKSQVDKLGIVLSKEIITDKTIIFKP